MKKWKLFMRWGIRPQSSFAPASEGIAPRPQPTNIYHKNSPFRFFLWTPVLNKLTFANTIYFWTN